jgi:S1-C subfamily serine protease
MTESPGGVRITGVRTGSPAEQAGMKGGDILIQLGDKTVRNLYDMTDALRAHQPGETVVLVYLRDGQRIETKVTLGTRGG